MEITLELLLKGKPTIIKEKTFLSTKEYVGEFIELMRKFTDKFVVNVSLPAQITVTNNEEDITFNKVWIQAILPGSELKETIHLVYALDVKKPCYKIFRTYSDDERHVVFNEKWIFSGLIKDEETFKLPVKELMEMENNVPLVIEKMKKTFLDDDTKYDLLGKLIEKSMLFEKESVTGKVKLSPTTIIKAHESIYMDATSKLYKKDQEPTVYDLYVALLEQVKDGYKKDMINIFEKSCLTKNLLEEQYESN